MIEHVRIKVALAFFFALLLNLFFYRSMGNMGIASFFALLFLFELSVLWREMKAYHLRGSIGFLALTLFLFLYNSVHTGNDFVAFTQYAGAFAVLAIIFSLTSSGRKAFRSVAELVFAPLYAAISYTKGFFTFLVFSFDKHIWVRIFPGKSVLVRWLRPLILGLGIGIPIVLVMAGLLSGGDPIFEHFLASLKLPQIPAEWLGRIQLTLMFFLLLVPIACLRVEKLFIHPLSSVPTLRIAKEMTIVLLLVVLTLGTFLIVQAPYIFVRVAFETDLSKFGVATYSEYVRRGFGELTAVVFLVYGVLWAAVTALRLQVTKREYRVLLGVSALVSVLICIFIASIARRVYLYQLYHGWSLIRLYGMWLLAWISLLFATLFLRFWGKRKGTLVNFEIVLSFLLLIAFGSWNAESFVVRTHPPTVNGRVDYTYLSRLSPDGIEGWEKAYGFARLTLVDKKLGQSEIKMEDRRDVAYSYYILARLIDQYRSLVMRYGSPQEQKEFVLAILENYHRFLSDRMVQTNDEVRKKMDDKISRWITDVEKGTATPKQINAFFLPRFSRGNSSDGDHFFETKEAFDPTEGIYVFMTEQDDYLNLSPEDTVLDRFYRYSWSGAHAYNEMKTKIPSSGIFELSQSYEQLFHAISRQPDGKRTFQSDISFTTPFAQ